MSLFLSLRALPEGSVAALKVKPLAIVDDQQYISYGLGPSETNSVLLCNYTLGEGQEVSGVLWEILKDESSAGTFEWKPNAPATGRCPLECVPGRAPRQRAAELVFIFECPPLPWDESKVTASLSEQPQVS